MNWKYFSRNYKVTNWQVRNTLNMYGIYALFWFITSIMVRNYSYLFQTFGQWIYQPSNNIKALNAWMFNLLMIIVKLRKLTSRNLIFLIMRGFNVCRHFWTTVKFQNWSPDIVSSCVLKTAFLKSNFVFLKTQNCSFTFIVGSPAYN